MTLRKRAMPRVAPVCALAPLLTALAPLLVAVATPSAVAQTADATQPPGPPAYTARAEGIVPAPNPTGMPTLEARALAALALLGRAGEAELAVARVGAAAAEGVADRAIMGRGEASAVELAAFILACNAALGAVTALETAELYVAECAAEGVDHDAAFSQMCLETGFLAFGGLVDAAMHNYCGLGSLGAGKPGESFPDRRTGVRAHVQHLKAYASTAPLARATADPRARFVERGRAPRVSALSGAWAADPAYGDKLAAVIARLEGFRRALHRAAD